MTSCVSIVSNIYQIRNMPHTHTHRCRYLLLDVNQVSPVWRLPFHFKETFHCWSILTGTTCTHVDIFWSENEGKLTLPLYLRITNLLYVTEEMARQVKNGGKYSIWWFFFQSALASYPCWHTTAAAYHSAKLYICTVLVCLVSSWFYFQFQMFRVIYISIQFGQFHWR